MNYYKIKIELENRGISVKDFCRQIDLTEQGFYQMIRNESMKVDVLERISEALSVSMSYWFDTNDYAPVKNADVPEPVTEKKESLISLKQIDAVTSELNKILKKLATNSGKSVAKNFYAICVRLITSFRPFRRPSEALQVLHFLLFSQRLHILLSGTCLR